MEEKDPYPSTLTQQPSQRDSSGLKRDPSESKQDQSPPSKPAPRRPLRPSEMMLIEEKDPYPSTLTQQPSQRDSSGLKRDPSEATQDSRLSKQDPSESKQDQSPPSKPAPR